MQLMSDGFIHCDPHEGNLLGLADGGDLQGWMDDERLYAGTADQAKKRLGGILF